ncbi:MAG: hypothetical protein U0326_08365 [Polyangiales bacterium]
MPSVSVSRLSAARSSVSLMPSPSVSTQGGATGTSGRASGGVEGTSTGPMSVVTSLTDASSGAGDEEHAASATTSERMKRGRMLFA